MELIPRILDLIDGGVSPYHAADSAARRLTEAGFTELTVTRPWELTPGKGYFVRRGASSCLAFRVPREGFRGYLISAAHCDSPTLQLKENYETVKSGVMCLDVENYGGAILHSWYDRPLGVAGHVMVRSGEGCRGYNVALDEDLCLIPSMAPHLAREDKGMQGINVQTDMQPVLGGQPGDLKRKIAGKLGAAPEDIEAMDLSLFSRQKGTVCGVGSELLVSPRLDDLMCAFTTLEGFLQAKPAPAMCTVWCLFNHEEIGSGTPEGADSDYLRTLLARLSGGEEPALYQRLENSFVVSADNAQGLHPNHPDKYDPLNSCRLNGGVVIKHNANRRYATNAYSDAVFKAVCRRAGVPVQTYANRSDIPGGSTLGRLSVSHVSIPTVDVGLAQLAMHSCVETAGVKDIGFMVDAMRVFFSCDYLVTENGFTL